MSGRALLIVLAAFVGTFVLVGGGALVHSSYVELDDFVLVPTEPMYSEMREEIAGKRFIWSRAEWGRSALTGTSAALVCGALTARHLTRRAAGPASQ